MIGYKMSIAKTRTSTGLAHPICLLLNNHKNLVTRCVDPGQTGS